MENKTAFKSSTGAAKTERFAAAATAQLGSNDNNNNNNKNNIFCHYTGAKRPRGLTGREGFPGQNPAICGGDAPESDWPF